MDLIAGRTGSRLVRQVVQVAPGVWFSAAVAALALGLAQLLPDFVSPILVAVVLGLALGNLVEIPASAQHGIDFAAKRILRWGVVLLGAKLSLADVLGIGTTGLVVVVLCMAAAFATVLVASRAVGISSNLAILLAVGTAVCGNSAIVATAPVLEAEDRELGVAMATITVFGTVALMAFPLIAHGFRMGDSVFGFWTGLSINDTSQVVAASAAFSPQALEIATVVKLVRNSLMAPIIICIWWLRRSRSEEVKSTTALSAARKAFPGFVLGFLALATLRTLGVVTDSVASVLSVSSMALITVAIAAVGLSMKVASIRLVGFKPFVVGFAASASIAMFGGVLAHVVA